MPEIAPRPLPKLHELLDFVQLAEKQATRVDQRFAEGYERIGPSRGGLNRPQVHELSQLVVGMLAEYAQVVGGHNSILVTVEESLTRLKEHTDD